MFPFNNQVISPKKEVDSRDYFTTTSIVIGSKGGYLLSNSVGEDESSSALNKKIKSCFDVVSHTGYGASNGNFFKTTANLRNYNFVKEEHILISSDYDVYNFEVGENDAISFSTGGNIFGFDFIVNNFLHNSQGILWPKVFYYGTEAYIGGSASISGGTVPLIAKINSSRNGVDWVRLYNSLDFNGTHICFTPAPDGIYIATFTANGNQDAYVTKVDKSNGNIIWVRNCQVSGGNSMRPISIVLGANDHPHLVSDVFYSGQRVAILRLDKTNGNLLNSAVLSQNSSVNRVRRVVYDSTNQNFYFGITGGGANVHFYSIKESDFSLNWGRTFQIDTTLGMYSNTGDPILDIDFSGNVICFTSHYRSSAGNGNSGHVVCFFANRSDGTRITSGIFEDGMVRASLDYGFGGASQGVRAYNGFFYIRTFNGYVKVEASKLSTTKSFFPSPKLFPDYLLRSMKNVEHNTGSASLSNQGNLGAVGNYTYSATTPTTFSANIIPQEQGYSKKILPEDLSDSNGGMILSSIRNSNATRSIFTIGDSAHEKRFDITDPSAVQSASSGPQWFNGTDKDRIFTSTESSLSFDSRITSYLFAKKERFFDIVSWVGNGQGGRQIPHSLGIIPGMIAVRNQEVGSSGNFDVLHSSAPTGTLILNRSQVLNTSNLGFRFGNNGSGYVAPTSSHFTVGTDLNNNGVAYIALVFANDTSDDSIIKTGTYNGSTTNPVEINLGWEPQLFLVKSVNSTSNWILYDHVNGTRMLDLNAAVEDNNYSASTFDETYTTGLRIAANTSNINLNQQYVYLAIRKPSVKAKKQAIFRRGFVSNAASVCNIFDNSVNSYTVRKGLFSNEVVNGFDYYRPSHKGLMLTQDGFTAPNYLLQLQQEKGFFDVVTWAGNDSGSRQIPHSLASNPGMIIIRPWRTSGLSPSGVARIWHRSAPGISGNPFTNENWSSTSYPFTSEPTSVNLNVISSLNLSGEMYTAYIFGHQEGKNAKIKCGVIVGDGQDYSKFEKLGWCPQAITFKNIDVNGGRYFTVDVDEIGYEASDHTAIPPSIDLFGPGSTLNSPIDVNTPIQIKKDGFHILRTSNNGVSSRTIYLALRKNKSDWHDTTVIKGTGDNLRVPSKTNLNKFKGFYDTFEYSNKLDLGGSLLDLTTDALGNTYIVSFKDRAKISKFNSQNQKIWEREFLYSGTVFEIIHNNGNLYLAGSATDSTSSQTFPSITCLNAEDGSLLWKRKLTNIHPSNTNGYFQRVKIIDSNLYTVGRFQPVSSGTTYGIVMKINPLNGQVLQSASVEVGSGSLIDGGCFDVIKSSIHPNRLYVACLGREGSNREFTLVTLNDTNFSSSPVQMTYAHGYYIFSPSMMLYEVPNGQLLALTSNGFLRIPNPGTTSTSYERALLNASIGQVISFITEKNLDGNVLYFPQYDQQGSGKWMVHRISIGSTGGFTRTTYEEVGSTSSGTSNIALGKLGNKFYAEMMPNKIGNRRKIDILQNFEEFLEKNFTSGIKFDVKNNYVLSFDSFNATSSGVTIRFNEAVEGSNWVSTTGDFYNSNPPLRNNFEYVDIDDEDHMGIIAPLPSSISTGTRIYDTINGPKFVAPMDYGTNISNFSSPLIQSIDIDSYNLSSAFGFGDRFAFHTFKKKEGVFDIQIIKNQVQNIPNFITPNGFEEVGAVFARSFTSGNRWHFWFRGMPDRRKSLQSSGVTNSGEISVAGGKVIIQSLQGYTSGQPITMYAFAHNPEKGLYASSYVGNATSGVVIPVGFMPKFIMLVNLTSFGPDGRFRIYDKATMNYGAFSWGSFSWFKDTAGYSHFYNIPLSSTAGSNQHGGLAISEDKIFINSSSGMCSDSTLYGIYAIADDSFLQTNK